MRKATIVKILATMGLLSIFIVFGIVPIVNASRHEWHPIGPNVKFGTLIEEEKKEDGSESRPYAKKSFTWSSNEINEDTVTWTWGDTTGSFLTATAIDFHPDANAWVKLEWCSRHGEVRAVRVE